MICNKCGEKLYSAVDTHSNGSIVQRTIWWCSNKKCNNMLISETIR